MRRTASCRSTTASCASRQRSTAGEEIPTSSLTAELLRNAGDLRFDAEREVELKGLEGRRDRYPLYHELREAAPAHRSEFGSWLLSRFDDGRAALRDPRFGKDYAKLVEARFGPDWRSHPALAAGERSMLNVDGPEHTRLRNQVVKGFTRRRIEGLRETMERTVSELLGPYAEAGGGDLLEAVAFPLPVTVIGEMLGVPAADRPAFRKLVRDLVGTLEQQPSAEMVAAADAAQLTIREYFLELIATKRRSPRDDLLSQLARPAEGDRLDDEELATLASLLFGAGNHDPARNPDPDRLDLARKDVDPLSFGGGVHFCLGASLARLEVDVVFRTLLTRFGTIELAAQPRFMDRLTLRGLESLDLVCRAEAGPAARTPASALAVAVAWPAAPRPVADLDLDATVLGLRPADDARWREALRARAERGEAVRTDHTETAALLARTAIFRLCSAPELAELAATAYPMSFEPGNVLCSEGAESSECYAIAEGEAHVTIGGRSVRTVGEGDVVGERAPLEGRPRSATVTAVTHMLTWAISRERFLAVIGCNPAPASGPPRGSSPGARGRPSPWWRASSKGARIRALRPSRGSSRLQGFPRLTAAADITPDRSPENLEHLAAALRELDARVYTESVPEGLAFDCSAKTLARSLMWNLATSAGRLDVAFVPAGTEGFADLTRDAAGFEVFGAELLVASLADSSGRG